MKVAFFDTKDYDKNAFSAYNGVGGLQFKFFETKLNPDTAELAKGFDAVCVFVNDTVNKQVLNQLYDFGIRLVALRCAGFNNVDLQSAFNKVHVVRVPDYSPYAVAEHTMALLLCSIRRIHKAYNRTKDFNFSLSGLTGSNLNGKTIGIIGTGKIGKIFIELCKGFGMRILAYDKYPSNLPGVQNVRLEQLFPACDIISLHCPLTEDTYHCINKDTIQKMKTGVILLNTSRGALMDAEALLDGIKTRKIGGACLDVYEEESDLFFEDYSGHIMDDDTLARLITMPNVIVTSHQGFLTSEALSNIANTTVKNLLDYFRRGSLPNEICYKCSKLESCKKEGHKSCF